MIESHNINIKDSLETNMRKEATEMKKALEETGARINTNLEIISHLREDDCQRDRDQNYALIKNQLNVAIFERAKTFTDSINQCINGETLSKFVI